MCSNIFSLCIVFDSPSTIPGRHSVEVINMHNLARPTLKLFRLFRAKSNHDFIHKLTMDGKIGARKDTTHIFYFINSQIRKWWKGSFGTLQLINITLFCFINFFNLFVWHIAIFQQLVFTIHLSKPKKLKSKGGITPWQELATCSIYPNKIE